MSSNDSGRRVVITGAGIVSPIGIGVEPFWQSLSTSRTGISRVEMFEYVASPGNVGAEIKDFNDETAKKEYLKPQRKSIKLMCREIQLGVASASLAVEHSGLDLEQVDHERLGIEFGANLMLSPPSQLQEPAFACSDEEHHFLFEPWGTVGLGNMEPLWLLKYLPNMPACHIGIYADARGPNNSLTLEDASGNLALGEAQRILLRGSADVMIAGATGTTLHPLRTMHLALWNTLADTPEEPEKRCRPFDVQRTGQVVAEGACTVILENEAHARARGAKIWATLLGTGSSCVIDRQGQPNPRQAIANAMRAALRDAGLTVEDIGHINAHGMGSQVMDLAEAKAIHDVFGKRGTEVPVTSLKSYLGNSGSGSGILELMGSVVALQHGVIPPTLNCDEVDPECDLNVVCGEPLETKNKIILSVNVTRMGQAAAVICSV